MTSTSSAPALSTTIPTTIPATIAIVGRPNVGKSALFNRLIGKRHAVVAHEAGTTRDRISHIFDCNGYETMLVDTGGLESGAKEDIEADIQAQAKIAIADADLIFFVADISQELTSDDFAAANILRRSKKTIILIGNKYDHPNQEKNSYNVFELGFGKPINTSALHNLGIEELKSKTEKILRQLKFKKGKIQTDPNTVNICILGKPNAGKSSLVNALTNSQKVIVNEKPGTTRDAIDTELNYNEQKFNLIDTAGLRRRGKIQTGIEHFSALRCLKAIERTDIVVLLIDGKEGLTSQDTHIVQYAIEAQKGLIIAINKTDLFEEQEEEKDRIIARLQRRFTFVPWAPIIFISAIKKINIFEILKQSLEIIKERKKRIPEGELNAFIQKISFKHMPSSSHVRKPAFINISQVDVAPPKFLLHFKNAGNLHFSYPRYLENKIREKYGFRGTAVSLKFK
ncbi:ribosome biogenesis GTPase Der [Candidatus Peregrinibacteria bacterium]|nr:ribosome biogenesis GTPase Der [Candidatus Peregrinibacteria bacterium]